MLEKQQGIQRVITLKFSRLQAPAMNYQAKVAMEAPIGSASFLEAGFTFTEELEYYLYSCTGDVIYTSEWCQ